MRNLIVAILLSALSANLVLAEIKINPGPIAGVNMLKLVAALAVKSVAFLLLLLVGVSAYAQVNDADIAKKLNNPIADLINVPFQFNFDQNMGSTDKGERYLLNIQPVIPIGINEEWNVISRTILPVVGINEIPPGNDEFGLGDILQSLFFSPKEPTSGGWIWGTGPALLFPSATDEFLGGEKWGAGPTAVFLKQAHGWTYGALTNHIWSYAGTDSRNDISSTFMQPFLAYTTRTFATFTLNTEPTYDWDGSEWAVPLNMMVTQLFRIAGKPMSVQLGARYWAESSTAGPEGWGLGCRNSASL